MLGYTENPPLIVLFDLFHLCLPPFSGTEHLCCLLSGSLGSGLNLT